eukprot:scaffold88345_cov58-Phaeocystis_antarctica.AAC.3
MCAARGLRPAEPRQLRGSARPVTRGSGPGIGPHGRGAHAVRSELPRPHHSAAADAHRPRQPSQPAQGCRGRGGA